jgi:hypothetical protein
MPTGPAPTITIGTSWENDTVEDIVSNVLYLLSALRQAGNGSTRFQPCMIKRPECTYKACFTQRPGIPLAIQYRWDDGTETSFLSSVVCGSLCGSCFAKGRSSVFSDFLVTITPGQFILWGRSPGKKKEIPANLIFYLYSS